MIVYKYGRCLTRPQTISLHQKQWVSCRWSGSS